MKQSVSGRDLLRDIVRALNFALHAYDEIVVAGTTELNWKGRAVERVLAARRLVTEPRYVARRFRAIREREFGGPAPLLYPERLAGTVTAQFLTDFWAAHRRAPRILHVGNIANNAYLNAKLLNHSGYDCDVICHDYYHVMACPEWEDADFEGDLADQLNPDWRSVDLRGFTRPEWFAQGPLQLCIDYLIAKRREHSLRAEVLWDDLGRANRTKPVSSANDIGRRARALVHRLWQELRWRKAPERLWIRLGRWAQRYGRVGWVLASFGAPLLVFMLVAFQFIVGRRKSSMNHVELPTPTMATLSALNGRFAATFPGRSDQLVASDWLPFTSVLPRWAELFGYYDIVQAYATDVAYPLLTGKHPYVGFEHGTLRSFTLADSPTCRLTALGYRLADHVLITNGDCLEYAHKLAIPSFTPMVHPIDDRRISSVPVAYAEEHERFGAKYLFLCPLRHDWEVKGTDRYLRALPGIADRIGRNFRVIMTRWGADLDQSRELAAALGVGDLIAWIEPVNRARLIRLQKSVDVVFDQIALPHFGATAPQAIAAGVPVIMSYDPASTEWIIPEAAPILSAWTVEDIVKAVETALEPAWRQRYVAAARQWFDTYHSGDAAVRRLSEAYRTVARSTGVL